jgi:TRAP-type uncharacterized transport system substrate-binding protein
LISRPGAIRQGAGRGSFPLRGPHVAGIAPSRGRGGSPEEETAIITRRHILAAGLAAPALGAPGLALAEPRNPSWPRALTMGTAAPGSTYALHGPAWGQIVQEATGVNISCRATQGPNRNVILVHRREVELGMMTKGVALQG